MNKTAIKNFAVWARVQLIESAKQRAYAYEITDGGENKINLESISGRLLTKEEKGQRRQLISEINQKGYTQVMEEAAYTWFNRFIALRYMEVNGYLPSKIRVFTDENGAFKPEILKKAMTVEIDGLDRGKILDLLDKQDNEALYKYLLITQCNAFNTGLPYMFEKISNWTELLFPANLLRADSVIGRMISMIPEDDWKDAVQIIGWLYQYYNAEPKDKVFENLKKNIKISKENIPAATQLFTPDWIVRYMVENSLGRLWIEGHPDDELKAGWKYYLDEAEQEPEVQAQLETIRAEYRTLRPQDIKVIDPCMGSGHILVYAFDVLVQIYKKAGFNERDAAQSILQNNLYGLDIEDRAAQLAYFAVMMKARQYDRRIFTRNIQPHVYAIVESNGISDDILTYFENGDGDLKEAMETIIRELHDAKEYGSILNVTPVDFAALYARLKEIKEDVNLFAAAAQSELRPLIEVAEAMARKYDVVVTNPPYMGAGNMNPTLNQFIKDKYADYKSDFFSAFIVRASQMATEDGYCGFFTPYVWMFIQSYEKLRHLLCEQKTIETLIQFEYSAFEEATVPVCTFAFKNSHVNKKGCYLRLTEFRGGMEVQRQKTLEAIANHDCGFYYEASASNFSKIPGAPVAYWVKNFVIFDTPTLKKYIDARIGMVSGDNERFLRLWQEVSFPKIEYRARANFNPQVKKWYPLQKGGEFRKWYGNLFYVINWEKNGYELKFDNYMGKRIRSHNYNGVQQFKKGITWNSITSGKFHCRYSPEGFTYDAAGPLCEVRDEEILYEILAFLSSTVADYLFSLINPTINFPSGYLESLPYIQPRNEVITAICKQCISLSCTDWDSFETSWDFKKHPLV